MNKNFLNQLLGMLQSGKGASNEFSILDQLFGGKRSNGINMNDLIKSNPWSQPRGSVPNWDAGFRVPYKPGWADAGFRQHGPDRWGHLPPGAL